MKLVVGGRRDTDELYQVPLEEFTAARDALAARLKATGDKDGAAAAKGLRKPSVPAWAANQVVWQARADWERLRAATETLRRMQEQVTSADDLRQAARDQRDAVQVCEARAAELLEAHGHAAGPALQKVGHTLLALAHGTAEAQPGRVERELQPPGFEALAGLTLAAPPPAPPAPKPAPSPDPPAPKAVAPKAASGPVLVPRTSAPAPPAVAGEARAEAEEHERLRVARLRAQGLVAAAERAAEQAKKRLAAEEGGVEALARRLEEARRVCESAREAAETAQAEAAATRAALAALQEA